MSDEFMRNPIAIPSWWKSREDQLQNLINHNVKKGEIRDLAVSPGGRTVKAVFYGEQELELKGTANYNSAVAAGDSEYYYRRKERKMPVLMILAGVHGQELESMVFASSLIRLMETGKNALGQQNSLLREKLEQLRLIIIPVANPDGRARVPYDGWVGLPEREMTKYGQGTRKDGELYGWPLCKTVHPMRGDVGILGGYFDDAGINMEHDEWSSPMSDVTKAILTLAADEAPDILINMHSHNWDSSILPISYVSQKLREELANLESNYKEALMENGYGYRDLNILDGENSGSFDLTSILNHVCGGICFCFECPHGCANIRRSDNKPGLKSNYGYEDIMKVEELLVNCTADYLLNR